MRFIISFLLFTVSTVVYGQPFQVQGRVVNEADNKPLSGASVFINNGSKGTTTDQDGRFILTGISVNTFELIVSYVSYETIVINISPENISKRFVVKMSPRQNELEEVIIGMIEKDGFKKWGKLFLENFIGTSANAQKCVLLNPQTLIFRYDSKKRILRVSAREQLKIRNNALGYNINYQLEQFEYDASNTQVVYLGYIHFEDINSRSKRRSAIWIKERKVAYDGSMMHFMRSFYTDNLVNDGFNIRQLIRINKKDSSTRKYYDQITNKDYTGIDTSRYFIQFVRSSFVSAPVIFITGKQLLAADSIRYRDTINNQILMYSGTQVQVRYLKESESKEYLKMHGSLAKPGPQSSIFYFKNNRPVAVFENGLFFEPLDIFSEGYWAFEKLAEMLPSDYSVIK